MEKKTDKERVKVELLKIAKSSCKYCHGTGYIGVNPKTDKLVACQCVFKKIEKYRIEKMIKKGEVEK
jgi:hypothetical protein